MPKFFSGLAMLLLALFLQFQLAAVGLYFNIALATLIASAFSFDLLELLFLDLIAIFLINWQPEPNITLIAFALIPLAVYLFRRIVRTEPWLGNLICLFLGLLLFYLIGSPSFILSHLTSFLEDLVIALAAGELVFFVLN